MKPAMRVMVGILRDAHRRILINQRPAGKLQAGRWEFPGGKMEAGEAPEAALRRELHEELGIVAGPMTPLIQIEHHYPAFAVRLDVREVLHFGGKPRPREGQALKWVTSDELVGEDILEADRPIIQALRLPDRCLVTPDPSGQSTRDFLAALQVSLQQGVRLVQLRAPSLSTTDYVLLARPVLERCHSFGAALLLNGDPALLDELDADGIHLSGARLRRLHTRPVPGDRWLSASCHSSSDLLQAQRLSADFVLAGPVLSTASHPNASPVGWAGFRAMALHAAMPVYALGGVSPNEIITAKLNGGQGIAGIRSLWGAASRTG